MNRRDRIAKTRCPLQVLAYANQCKAYSENMKTTVRINAWSELIIPDLPKYGFGRCYPA